MTRKSVKAVGARKIWGTLKTTTSAAVKNALSSLIKVSCSDLQIKRKYKSSRRNPNTVAKWWFVIRGEENKLQELEGEWRAIAIQTVWKLGPVYYYEETLSQMQIMIVNQQLSIVVSQHLSMIALYPTMLHCLF